MSGERKEENYIEYRSKNDTKTKKLKGQNFVECFIAHLNLHPSTKDNENLAPICRPIL